MRRTIVPWSLPGRVIRNCGRVFPFAGAVMLGMGISLDLSAGRLETRYLQVPIAVDAMIAHSKLDGLAPKYRITSGEHAGITFRSSTYTAPPHHQTGDRETGHFDVETGTIYSATELRSRHREAAHWIDMGLQFAVYGFVLLMLDWFIRRRKARS